MNEDTIKSLVETTLQTQIVKAFHEAPEAIDKLVLAALSQEVNEYGGKPDYHSRDKMPYLQYLVGDTIRGIAHQSVKTTIEERKGEIEEVVRSKIKSEDLVNAFMEKLLGVLNEDWRVKINFANEKESKY